MDSSILLHGRPFGGCAILFRKSLINTVPMLSTSAKRFCAVRLSDQPGYTVLLICVYLLSMLRPPHMMTFSMLLVSWKASSTLNPLTVFWSLVTLMLILHSVVLTPHNWLNFWRSLILFQWILPWFTYEGWNSSSWIDHILTSCHFASCFTNVQKLIFLITILSLVPLIT